MNNSNWQVRFDKQFTNEFWDDLVATGVKKTDMKAFINSLLEEERQGLVKAINEVYPGNLHADEREDDYQRGWNEALKQYKDNLLSLLTKKE